MENLPIYPRRLASDDPQDAAILEARSEQIRTLDAAFRLELVNVLIEAGDRWSYQWLHDVVLSLGACHGEDVCGKDRGK